MESIIASLQRVPIEKTLERTRGMLRAVIAVHIGSDITITVGVRAVYRFIVDKDVRLIEHWVRHEMHASTGIEIATVLDCICEAILLEVGASTSAINLLDTIKTHVSEVIRTERRVCARVRSSDLVEAVMDAVETADPDLAEHLHGVGELAGRIAVSMDFSPDRVEYVENAGKMHDIGKLGLPKHVLYKPGKLTPEEFERIKEHSVIGERLLHEVPGLERYALATRMHHEALDGSGYPDGLRADCLPMEIRIISVADVYNALTSERCYRQPFTAERALAMLHDGMDTRWDATVIGHLEDVLAGPARLEQRHIA